MNRWLVSVLILLMSAVAHAQLYPAPDGETYLGPITPNAYGPGINSDATGRPFYWNAPGTGQMGPYPTIQPHVNQYGFGQSADQYGRPIQPVPLDRQPGSRPDVTPGMGMNGSNGPLR